MNETEFKAMYLGEFKPEVEKVFVFAASHWDYGLFIREHRLNKIDFNYINNPETLRGTLRPKYIMTNNHKDNRNWFEIRKMLNSRGAVDITYEFKELSEQFKDFK